MGLIRKTVSIATVGIVPFRSKKEQLRRARRDHEDAVADLEREKGARSSLDSRVAAAEKRAREAELKALQVAKRLAKAKDAADDGRRKRRKARGAAAAAALTSAASTAEEKASTAAAEAVKLGRRARKQAKQAAAEAQKMGRRARKRAEKAAKKRR